MGEGELRCGSGASIIVQEVMEEEWTALRSEQRGLPSLWGPAGMAEVGVWQSRTALRAFTVSELTS